MNDEIKPSASVNDSTLDMMLGVWVSDSYDFMGTKWIDEINFYMKHNGNYFIAEVTSKTDEGMTYNSTGYVSFDKDGNLKGWFFDDSGITSFRTGKTDGNKISMTGKTEMSSNSIDIEINGDVMVHKGTAIRKDKDGKETTQKYEVTYKKKK